MKKSIIYTFLISATLLNTAIAAPVYAEGNESASGTAIMQSITSNDIGEIVAATRTEAEQVRALFDKGIIDAALVQGIVNNLQQISDIANEQGLHTLIGYYDDFDYMYATMFHSYDANIFEAMSVMNESAITSTVGGSTEKAKPVTLVYDMSARLSSLKNWATEAEQNANKPQGDSSGLANFVDKNAPIAFSDVPTTAWYHTAISESSKLGILNGMGDDTFNPEGKLTYGQALSLAVKTHGIYFGIKEPEPAKSGHWATNILEYAKKYEIVDPDAKYDLDANCTRGDMAEFFCGAVVPKDVPVENNLLPNGVFEAINDLSLAPEKFENPTISEKAIQILYQAGVFIGDDRGFRKDDSVSRAEAAAIILRVAKPSQRQTVTADTYGTVSPSTSTNQAGYEYKDYQIEMLGLVNATRASYHLPPLELDPYLCLAADQLALEYSQGAMAHNRLNGDTIGSVWEDIGIKFKGRLPSMDSNYGINQQTPSQFHTSVMNSAGHAKFVTSYSNTKYGVARCKTTTGIYWVELFALPFDNVIQ